MIKECKWCNGKFETEKSNQKYCIQCKPLPKDLLSGKTFDNRNIQICKYCKKEFYRNRKTKYCSEECQKEYTIYYAKEKRKQPDFEYKRKVYAKVCIECGDVFETKVNKTKYCSLVCASAKRPQNQRKNFIIYRGKEHLKDWNYTNWRKRVFERDKYKCNCCGYDKGKILNAHHLEGWNENIDLRYEVSNGVSLCEKCHMEFHNQYGYGKNTKQQYIEFLESKKEVIVCHK